MYKLAFVIGTRPDIIRCSKLIKLLDGHVEIELIFIYTGQHYDKNLFDIFLEQLSIRRPNFVLKTGGVSACQQHSALISQLESILIDVKPDACLFWGDTNAVIGCIVPLKLGIPIIHGESGMRSYNWDMPEERNRVIIDRVSDVLYVYQDDYRVQLVQEGIDPSKIVVTGNVIVDVINEHSEWLDWPVGETFIHTDNWTRRRNESLRKYFIPQSIGDRSLLPDDYALMTLHRNEHVSNPSLAQEIIYDVERAMRCSELKDKPVVLIEMPRLKQLKLFYPERFIVVPPLGFFEFLRLEANAAIEYTDSGTNQEVASILGTPCVVTRSCTERPECADCNQTILATFPSRIPAATHWVLGSQRNESFTLGDGESSERIVNDLIKRLRMGVFKTKTLASEFKMRHFKGI